MISRLFKALNYKKRRSDFELFKQPLFEVLAMLACALLLMLMLGLMLFICIQSSQYFLPMSTYQITTLNEEQDSTKATLLQGTEATKTLGAIQYVLSHESAELLTKRLTRENSKQFLATDILKPIIIVKPLDSLYLLSTHSGQTFVGEFISLQQETQEYFSPAKLAEIRLRVSRLQENLHDIQIQGLQSLHKEINALNTAGISSSSLLYINKLAEFTRWQTYANKLLTQIESNRVNIRLDSGRIMSIAVSNLQDLYQPNALKWSQTIRYGLNKLYVFLTDYPKQASTSGGVYPAIFGTILMVIIMAIVVTPFGAISAIYLHEYAPNNQLTHIIRICVSNMAVVPSVVYGVFGLGFFVYGLGGAIDSLLYAEKLPSPTFGAPGLFWASLTMGILTLPIVIVATEESLSRVPRNLRTGASALGATKFETLTKVVLPIASPGILSGVILAVARAAGEVAPLLLVGAVKYAPALPIDGTFPYVHLERQFMDLGVFIYDGAFHNQNESQVSSLVFASCMLLLFIVLLLNMSSIIMRNKLANKYERL